MPLREMGIPLPETYQAKEISSLSLENTNPSSIQHITGFLSMCVE